MKKNERSGKSSIDKADENEMVNTQTLSNLKNDHLDIIDYYTIETDYEYEKKLGENLCEAFIISGLSREKSEIIENSFDFTPICRHSDCAIFPAIKPSILYKFPKIASMCFPFGIKLCLCQDESKIEPINNFVSTITNCYGERLYLYNCYFFIKIPFADYQIEYKINPINEYGKFTGLLASTLTGKNSLEIKRIEETINKNLEICFECLSRDDIYLPYCFSLISLYPNASAFEKILLNLNNIIINHGNNNEELIISQIEQLLTHVVHEIPIPTDTNSLSIYLPHFNERIKISNIIHNNFPCLNYDCTMLLDYFSIENLISIHYLLLCEQKTIFVVPNGEYHILLKIIESFLSLLYPLKWENTLIPCLSWEFVKYLQSFMPYIMGIEENCLDWIKTYTEGEIVYVVNVRNNTIDGYIEDGSVKAMNFTRLSLSLPKFPKENFEFLNNSLKNLHDSYKYRHSIVQKRVSLNFEVELREVFMKSMIILLNDYRSYTIKIDDIPLIDVEYFIEKRSISDKEFMREFLQTRNFQQFLQLAMTDFTKEWNYYYEKESTKYLLDKTCRKSSTLETVTRMSQILNVKDLHSLQNLPSAKEEEFSSFTEVKRNAVLYPYFLSDEFVTSSKEINNYYKKNSQSVKTSKENAQTKSFLSSIDLFLKLFQTPIEFIRKYKSIKQTSNERRTFKIISKSIKPNNITEQNFKNLDVTKRLKLIKGRISTHHKEDGVNLKNNLISKQCIKHKQSLLSMISTCKSQEELNIFQDQMTEMIIDYLRGLITNTSLQKENFSDVSRLLRSRFARAKFASILYQEKFKNNEGHCLSCDSFKQLKEVIFNSLVFADGDENQFEDVMLITKSMFFYYKSIENAEQYFIFQDIIIKKGAFVVWKNQNFWRFYLDNELDGNSQNVSSKIIEEEYVKSVLSVVGVMTDLILDSKFIYDCISCYVQGINKINLDFLLK